MTDTDGLLRVEPLGATRHARLYPLTTPRWRAPSLRVVYRKSFGFAPYAPGMQVPHVRVRPREGVWSDLNKAYRLTRPAELPLPSTGSVEIEIWEGAVYGQPLCRQIVEAREWDIYLMFLHSAGREAQRWFGRSHWIEAGWIGDHPPSQRALARAKPWH